MRSTSRRWASFVLATVFLAATTLPVSGPGVLCGAVSSFRLESNETILSASGGLHAGSAVIRTNFGDLYFAESDIFNIKPKGPSVKGLSAPVRKGAFPIGPTGYAFYGHYPG